ncbi:MAG TPA: hypothetical protein VL360_01400 [Gammaproteobacteria bacterium]|jgi:hypothetical protein|nr:hypothetical protein [Gammaproteobacteria bacterium]
MTQSRGSETEVKPTKKLIDNLERVADDLILYTLEVASVYDQIAHIQKAREYYKNTWLWFIYKRFSRFRDPEAVAIINKLNQCGSGLAVLEELDKAYSHGGMNFGRSLNPYWLLDMALALPGYTDTHENCSLSEKDLTDLKELFLVRANQVLRPTESNTEEINVDIKKLTLTEQKSFSKQQQKDGSKIFGIKQGLDEISLRRRQEQDNELSQIRQAHKLGTTAKTLISSTVYKSKQNTNVHPLDRAVYGDVMKNLDECLKNGLDKQKVNSKNEEGSKMKVEFKKLNPALIMEMEILLFNRINSAAAVYKENLGQEVEAEKFQEAAPVNVLKPCAAAFEKPVESKPITGNPQKLRLSDEHRMSLNRLFGGNPVTKDAENDYMSSEEISPPSSPPM